MMQNNESGRYVYQAHKSKNIMIIYKISIDAKEGFYLECMCTQVCKCVCLHKYRVQLVRNKGWGKNEKFECELVDKLPPISRPAWSP